MFFNETSKVNFNNFTDNPLGYFEKKSIIIPGIALFLTLVGLYLLADSSIYYRYTYYKQPAYFLLNQLISVIIGLTIFFIIQKYNIKELRKNRLFFLIICILVRMLPFLPKNITSLLGNWFVLFKDVIIIGPIYISISLLSIILFVLYMAGLDPSEKSRKIFIPAAIMALIMALQGDPVSIILLFCVTAGYLYFYKKSNMEIFKMFLIFIIAFTFYIIKYFQFFINRIEAVLLTETHGSSYQIIQSLRGFIQGGLFGKGFKGADGYLPEAHVDYIFSSLGETHGLIGVIAVIFGFVIFYYLAMVAVQKTNNSFEKILVYLMSHIVIFYTLIGMATAVNLIPANGEGIPFLSFNGGKMILGWITAGLIFRGYKMKEENKVPQDFNLNLNKHMVVVVTLNVFIILKIIYIMGVSI